MVKPPCTHVERLFWLLRAEKLPDFVMHEGIFAEHLRLGLRKSDSPDPDRLRYDAVRRVVGEEFPDAEWLAANAELNRIVGIASDCYMEPGAIERQVPGYTSEFYARLRSDTAFSMR